MCRQVKDLKKLNYTFLIALCYSVLLWLTLSYYYFFVLCSINKKKKTYINIYMYIKRQNSVFKVHMVHLSIGRFSALPRLNKLSTYIDFSKTDASFIFQKTGRARGFGSLTGEIVRNGRKRGYHSSLTITTLV